MAIKRQVVRDFSHAEEHIQNAKDALEEGYSERPNCRHCIKVKKNDRSGEILMNMNMALGIIKNGIKREMSVRRKTDIN